MRAAAMATLEYTEVGIDRWLGASLSSALVSDHDALSAAVGRGLDELKVLLADFKIL